MKKLLQRIRSVKFMQSAQACSTQASTDALLTKGHALADKGRPQEALRLYDAAIQLAPGLARAHVSRGNALIALDEIAAALIAFQTALKHDSKYAGAHFNIGNAYARSGNRSAALAAYESAIALNPDFAEAHAAMGAVLDDLQQYEAAITSYQKALEIRPTYAEVQCNMALALRNRGEFVKALAHCRKALELKPSYAQGHSILGNVLKDMGQLREAVTLYNRALALDPLLLEARSNLLFVLNYGITTDPSVALSEARRFGALVAKTVRCYTVWPNVFEDTRCLRIGFVSGDFCDHPVSYFFEGVLTAIAQLPESNLKVFCYSNNFLEDAVTLRIKSLCVGWCTAAGMSDDALGERIREDSIDILVDLSGHTSHNRLTVFASKPAPLQVSWLGYFGTTGVAAIDYVIADPWTLPSDEEANFTEKIWRLPETRLCFTPPNVHLEVGALPAIRNGYITFGCCNNLSKMTENVVAVWAQVLCAVPTSRLFLKSPQLAESQIRQRVSRSFAARGIGIERLQFEGLSSRTDYLACYQRVDIALDPFPYTGGTTTAEALWMGVPVLTLKGERFLSRQGVGLLANAGLIEWIASSADDYVARATKHSRDLSALARLRAALRQQVLASPIFNANRFADHFNNALRKMWQRRCLEQHR